MDCASERTPAGGPVAWTAADLDRDDGWIFRLDDAEARELIEAVRAGRAPDKPLLAYRRADFPLRGVLDRLGAAFREASDGRGVALVKGLPRDGVSPEEFELMTWAIGLHFGVARPQDRTSAYINKVRDAGTQYRSASGRGYSSRAELDFHVDSGDVVLLSCYNQAPVGGTSMCTSSVRALQVMRDERPDLAQALESPFPYSWNGEEVPGEAPWFSAPLAGVAEGRAFCVWNRNRLVNALKLDGVPPLTMVQAEAVGYLDAVVRRPDLMFCMQLEPGDLQILSNYTVLHSRTAFADHPEEDRKRTLFRLWLALPGSGRLPAGWEGYSGTREPGTVRGGVKGHRYDDRCRRFDAEQAADLGMRLPA